MKRPLFLLAPCALAACAGPLPDGELVEGAWLRPASEVEARLEVACAGASVGGGDVEVVVDDASGFTLLREVGSSTVFLRDGYGVVSDLCWWMTRLGEVPEPLPADLPCLFEGRQDGSCTGGETLPPSFEFRTPGAVSWDGSLDGLTSADGFALGATGGDSVARLDLTEAGYAVPGVEDNQSFRTFVAPGPGPGGAVSAVATAAAGVVAWDADAGDLYVAAREQAAAIGFADAPKRSAPKGPGALAAAGDFAVVAVEGAAWVYEGVDGDGKPSKDKRHHPALTGVLDAAVHPGTGTAYVLVADGVVGMPRHAEPTWHPTPGAQGLLMAWPGGVPTVYAWGNDGGAGVVYRLEAGGVAVAHRLESELRGAGIGETFQELVLVTAEADGVVARGWLDEAHLAAIGPDTIGLAIAAFVESPRDEQTLSIGDAQRVAGDFGLCADPPPAGVRPEDWMVCCVHAERAAFAAPQLEWLDMRLQEDWPGGPAAVVMGIVPSVWAPSTYCAGLGSPELEALGRSLPDTVVPYVADWIDRGVGSAAVLLHNQPYEDPFASYSSWLACPDLLAEEAPEACWDYPYTAEAQADFYQALTDAAAVAPWWGSELDWTGLGGAYEGAAEPGLPAWVDFYPELVLPDGERSEDGIYFGLLAMDPRASGPASKELAPGDARQRALGVAVGLPVGDWASGSGAAGTTYWAGNTFASPWMYELRRSGLLFLDFNATTAESDQWLTDAFRGEEHSRFMTHADFALQLHYLTTRVVAHRNTLAPRWWYFHLQNVDNIRDEAFHTGWIACDGDCWQRTELDVFIEAVAEWSPVVHWSARPPR
jgi:hypothetical protein